MGTAGSVHRADGAVARRIGLGTRPFRPDPDGPLPEDDPVPRPIVRDARVRPETARTRRNRAKSGARSPRQRTCRCARSPSETSQRTGFAGTPGQVADELTRWVRADATDGFNISPYLVPGGLDEIVDWLVPGTAGAWRLSHRVLRRRRCVATSDFVNP